MRIELLGTIPANMEELRQAIAFEQRHVQVYGKTYPQPRLTKWYGESAYRYSGLTWEPCPMPEPVKALCRAVEVLTGSRYNSVLCNLYRNGSDGVGWHSDDEPVFGEDPDVASLSYGATRTFKVRHKTSKEQNAFQLSHGSLLYMGAGFQKFWQHCIPTTKKEVGERINLTFRRTV